MARPIDQDDTDLFRETYLGEATDADIARWANEYDDLQKALEVRHTNGNGHGPARMVGWPELDPKALYGLAGEVVEEIEPHTEADPVGLLFDFLTAFGNCVGGGPHAVADGSVHPARHNVVLVGQSAKARKGTARANIRSLFDIAEPEWSTGRTMGGLSSGEGLIAAVSDPNDDNEGGSKDKRLLIYESEFARVLKVAGRDGSTLSPIVRDAWDSGQLRVMTRNNPLSASGAHVSIIGHITSEELLRCLTETESANGFANRFCFACVRRSKLLPSGGNMDDHTRNQLAKAINATVGTVRSYGLIRRTPAAEARWAELYAQMADDDPGGLSGSITARAEAQTLRLSVTYALLDSSHHIDVDHLEAAYGAWRYCYDSALYLFRDKLGHEDADKLLAAVRTAGPAGLTRSDIGGKVFSGKLPKTMIDDAIDVLVKAHLVELREVETAGRPRSVIVAIQQG